MDHVPKWVAAPASDAVLTQDEIAIKNSVARERFSAKKTKQSFAALAELNNPGSLPARTSTQVKGVEAGGGSDKKRITTIMTQALHHWFDPKLEPTGSILPTVSIFFGSHGYLEDLDDSGFDVREQKTNAHNFFRIGETFGSNDDWKV
jgi:hypothetical protein